MFLCCGVVYGLVSLPLLRSEVLSVGLDGFIGFDGPGCLGLGLVFEVEASFG